MGVSVEQLAATAAQQNAMRRGARTMPHGVRLFRVMQGWESTVIRQSSAVADTPRALEAALRDSDVKTVLIPLEAALSDADIERLCARNATIKTLFREVKEA